MANNIQVLDGNGVLRTVSTTETGGVHVPHHIIDNFPSSVVVVEASLDTAIGAPGALTLPGAVQVGGSDGTHFRTFSTDSSGQLNVNVVSGVSSNPSIGLTGVIAPTSATEIGTIDAVSGDLEGLTSDVRGAKNVLAVEIVDAAGNQITSFGSATVTANQGTASPAAKWSVQVDNASPIPISGAVTVSSGSIAVTNAGTFAVQATLAAETTKVIGTVNQGTSPWVVSGAVTVSGTATVSGTVSADIQGSTGVALDAVLGATKPANVLQVGGNDGTNAYAIPLASGGSSVVVSGSIAATNPSVSTTGTGVPADATYMGGNKAGSLVGVSLDGSGNLNVNVAAGGTGNAAASATGAGVPADADYIGVDIAGNLVGVTGFSLTGAKAAAVAIVDASGNQITSFGGGTQYATGDTVATPTGTAALGWDGTDVRVLATDSGGQLKVLVENTPAVTVSGTASVSQITSPWITADQADGTVGGAGQPATAIQIGSYDGANFRAAGIDAAGDLQVDIVNTPAVTVSSGSISATQGTSPWLDQLNGVQAIVSAANSSTTPLGGNASFTGTSIDLTLAPGYTAIQVQVLASQNGTLQIQFSTDNTNWDHIITGLVTAADSTSIATGIHGRYVRVVYVNGSTTQVGGYFRLQTLLVPTVVSPTIKDLDTPMDGDDNALSARALITGRTTAGGGSFVDVKVNPSGALTAAVTAAAGDVIIEGADADNATNSTAKLPVLAARANAAAPSWTEGHEVPLSTDLSGQLRVNATFTGTLSSAVTYSNPTTSPLLQAVVSFSASGDTIVIAGTGGQTVRIFKMWIVFGGTCNFKFGDSTPAYFSGAAPAVKLGSFTLVLDGDPHYVTASGKGFVINTDAAVQVSGTIWYTKS